MNILTPEVISTYVGYGLASFAVGWGTAILFTTFKKFGEKI